MLAWRQGRRRYLCLSSELKVAEIAVLGVEQRRRPYLAAMETPIAVDTRGRGIPGWTWDVWESFRPLMARAPGGAEARVNLLRAYPLEPMLMMPPG